MFDWFDKWLERAILDYAGIDKQAIEELVESLDDMAAELLCYHDRQESDDDQE